MDDFADTTDVLSANTTNGNAIFEGLMHFPYNLDIKERVEGLL